MTHLTIACAVDLSDCSRRALRYADALAAHFGAQLLIIHVTDERAAPPAQPHTAAASAREGLYQFVASELPFASAPGSLSAVEMRHGNPGREILKFARMRRADLLVMGTHGRTGVQTILGSTLEHALRDASIPILAVPLDAHGGAEMSTAMAQPGPVIAPVDFSPASITASRVARGIASALSVPLLLVHVVSPAASGTAPGAAANAGPDENPQTLMNALVASLAGGVEVEPVIRYGSRGAEISAVAVERLVSVIVMSLRGEGAPLGLHKRGVIACDVMRQAPVPVLAVPPHARHAFAAPTLGARDGVAEAGTLR